MKALVVVAALLLGAMTVTMYNRTDLEWEIFRFRNSCELTGEQTTQRSLFREKVGNVYHYIPAVIRVREWQCNGGRKFLMSY